MSDVLLRIVLQLVVVLLLLLLVLQPSSSRVWRCLSHRLVLFLLLRNNSLLRNLKMAVSNDVIHCCVGGHTGAGGGHCALNAPDGSF